MQSVIGMFCMCLCGFSASDREAAPVGFYQPIELVSTEFEQIPDVDLAISKRIAPQPINNAIIEKALDPREPAAPALPAVAADKIETAKDVVDEMLGRKASSAKAAVSTVIPSRQRIESNEPVTIRSVKSFAAQKVPVADIPALAPAVVGIVDSTSIQFVVPDPTDDQFITNPQPISIEFQDQLKTPPPSVETVVVPPVDSAETASEQLPVVTEPVQKIVVAPTEVPEPTVVEPAIVETPTVETPTVETVIPEPVIVETPVVETPVIETSVVETPEVEVPVAETVSPDAVVQETVVTDVPVVEATPAQSELPDELSRTEIEKVIVTGSWSSLNDSTRQTILMLIEADQMTHQLATQQITTHQ